MSEIINNIHLLVDNIDENITSLITSLQSLGDYLRQEENRNNVEEFSTKFINDNILILNKNDINTNQYSILKSKGLRVLGNWVINDGNKSENLWNDINNYINISLKTGLTLDEKKMAAALLGNLACNSTNIQEYISNDTFIISLIDLLSHDNEFRIHDIDNDEYYTYEMSIYFILHSLNNILDNHIKCQGQFLQDGNGLDKTSWLLLWEGDMKDEIVELFTRLLLLFDYNIFSGFILSSESIIEACLNYLLHVDLPIWNIQDELKENEKKENNKNNDNDNNDDEYDDDDDDDEYDEYKLIKETSHSIILFLSGMLASIVQPSLNNQNNEYSPPIMLSPLTSELPLINSSLIPTFISRLNNFNEPLLTDLLLLFSRMFLFDKALNSLWIDDLINKLIDLIKPLIKKVIEEMNSEKIWISNRHRTVLLNTISLLSNISRSERLSSLIFNKLGNTFLLDMNILITKIRGFSEKDENVLLSFLGLLKNFCLSNENKTNNMMDIIVVLSIVVGYIDTGFLWSANITFSCLSILRAAINNSTDISNEFAHKYLEILYQINEDHLFGKEEDVELKNDQEIKNDEDNNKKNDDNEDNNNENENNEIIVESPRNYHDLISQRIEILKNETMKSTMTAVNRYVLIEYGRLWYNILNNINDKNLLLSLNDTKVPASLAYLITEQHDIVIKEGINGLMKFCEIRDDNHSLYMSLIEIPLSNLIERLNQLFLNKHYHDIQVKLDSLTNILNNILTSK